MVAPDHPLGTASREADDLELVANDDRWNRGFRPCDWSHDEAADFLDRIVPPDAAPIYGNLAAGGIALAFIVAMGSAAFIIGSVLWQAATFLAGAV